MPVGMGGFQVLKVQAIPVSSFLRLAVVVSACELPAAPPASHYLFAAMLVSTVVMDSRSAALDTINSFFSGFP